MRFLVQIAAILAFVLATSQFSHGHEIRTELNPHVHGHEMAASDHHDNAPIQIGHDNAVHCGALLLLLTSETALISPRTYESYGVFSRTQRTAIHLTFDPPPPRV